MKTEIERLIKIRMEITKIYMKFPLELQKKEGLKADCLLQEEISRLEKWHEEPTCKSCGQSKDIHPWACNKFVNCVEGEQ